MAREKNEIELVTTSGDSLVPYQPGAGYPPQGYYPDYYAEGFSEGGRSQGPSPLVEIWRAVRRRKWLILAFTAVVTCAVAAEVSRYRDTYTASVILEVKRDSSPLAAGSEVDLDNSIGINTKILNFQSRPLLENVAVQLDLPNERNFLDVGGKRSWGQMIDSFLGREKAKDATTGFDSPQLRQDIKGKDATTSFVPLAGNAEAQDFPESNPRLDRYVGVIQNGLEVSKPRDTQALKISFTHNYPTIAARVANGLAQAFIKKQLDQKREKISGTSTWLDKASEDLKGKAEQAQQAVVSYARDHNLFPSQGQTLASDKLVRLHEQVTRAEMELVVKKSLYDEVVQGRGDRLPEAFTDVKLNELKKRVDDLSVQIAAGQVNYGPDNPKLKELEEQREVLQKQLNSSKSALEDKLKADYERGERDKNSLAAALEQAKQEASQQDQAAVQYTILKQEAATAQGMYTEFLSKAKQTSLLEVANQRSNINVIQPAQVPKRPDGPSYAVAVLLALLGSLAGAIGIAFVFEHFDQTIKGVADVNQYLQLPTLGVIPSVAAKRVEFADSNGRNDTKPLNGNDVSAKKGLGKPRIIPSGLLNAGETDASRSRFVAMASRPLVAEAYRALRTSVLLSTAGGPPKILLFTSSQPAEGKTTTVVNTAISFAQLGGSVLIIDADLRKPSVHDGFGISRDVGLSSYLSGSVDLDSAIHKLQIPAVSLLPCGPIPPNPAELISSDKMKAMLRSLSERYDHILIDSPPLLCATDPVILSTLVDGVIMIVRGGKSNREAVAQSRQMLSSVGARIFGIVLNDIDFKRMSNREFAYYPYYSEATPPRDVESASDLLRE